MKVLNLTDTEESIKNPYFDHLARVDNLYLSTKVENKNQIKFLKDLNIEFAIDLKQKEETNFDDKNSFEKAGIDYFNLPVSDISKVSFNSLYLISELLENKNKNVLLYCYSANRAAAILALQLYLVHGHSKKRTIDLASKIGLKGNLKKKVLTILDKKKIDPK